MQPLSFAPTDKELAERVREAQALLVSAIAAAQKAGLFVTAADWISEFPGIRITRSL